MYISSYTSHTLNHTSHRNHLPFFWQFVCIFFQLSVPFLNTYHMLSKHFFVAISGKIVCNLGVLFVHFMWLSYVFCLYFLCNENVNMNELETLGTKSFIIPAWEIPMVVIFNSKLNLSLIKTCSILPNRIQYSLTLLKSVVIIDKFDIHVIH